MQENLTLKLYRKRHIPNELVYLKDDLILRYEPGALLLTAWQSLKPRRDFVSGVSAYFIDKGIKVSKLLDCNNQITIWYCDIGCYHFDESENSLTFEDLLFDVIVYEDGSYRIADIGEAADAYQHRLISEEQLVYAMHVLEQLLETINNGEFAQLQNIVNQAY